MRRFDVCSAALVGRPAGTLIRIKLGSLLKCNQRFALIGRPIEFGDLPWRRLIMEGGNYHDRRRKVAPIGPSSSSKHPRRKVIAFLIKRALTFAAVLSLYLSLAKEAELALKFPQNPLPDAAAPLHLPCAPKRVNFVSLSWAREIPRRSRGRGNSIGDWPHLERSRSAARPSQTI